MYRQHKEALQFQEEFVTESRVTVRRPFKSPWHFDNNPSVKPGIGLVGCPGPLIRGEYGQGIRCEGERIPKFVFCPHRIVAGHLFKTIRMLDGSRIQVTTDIRQFTEDTCLGEPILPEGLE